MPQDNIFAVLNHYKYPHSGKGVCNGFSLLGLRAILRGGNAFETFQQRWRSILNPPADLCTDERHKLRAFLDEVLLYQQPYQHADFFHTNPPTGQDTNRVSTFLDDIFHKTQFGTPATKTYNQATLSQYFEEIKNKCGVAHVAIALKTTAHAIGVAYFPDTKKWVLIDANQSPDIFYINEHQLAKAVIAALLFYKGQVVTMTATMYTHDSAMLQTLDKQWFTSDAKGKNELVNKAKQKVVYPLLEENKLDCCRVWLNTPVIAKEMEKEITRRITIKTQEKENKNAEKISQDRSRAAKIAELSANGQAKAVVEDERKQLIAECDTLERRKNEQSDRLRKIQTNITAAVQRKQVLQLQLNSNKESCNQIQRELVKLKVSVQPQTADEIKDITKKEKELLDLKEKQKEIEEILAKPNPDESLLNTIKENIEQHIAQYLDFNSRITALTEKEKQLSEKGKEITAAIAEYNKHITRLEQEIRDIEAAILRIPQDVLQEYEKRFEKEWEREQNPIQLLLKQQLEAHFFAYDPEEFLKKLFIRHPWLERELDVTDAEDAGSPLRYLVDCLTSLLKQFAEWKNGVIQTGAVPVDLATYIQGAKNSHQGQYWINEYKNNFPLLVAPYSNSYSWRARLEQPTWHGNPTVTYTPHRIDVYRILNNLRSYDGSAIPVTLNELGHLAQEKALNGVTLLVINTGTEEGPKWIVAHRLPQSTWNLYTQDNAPLSADHEQLLKGYFGGYIEQKINTDINNNTPTDFVALKAAESMWNIMVFSRLIPSLINNLPQLRAPDHHIPLPILWWNTLENMWKLNISITGAAQAQYQAAFKIYGLLTGHHFAFPKASENVLSPELEQDLMNTLNGKLMLDDFIANRVVLNTDCTLLTVTAQSACTPEELVRTLYHLYHIPTLTKLTFPLAYAVDGKMNSTNELTALHDALFDSNVSLWQVCIGEMREQVLAPINPTFIYATQCAARNRFLASIAPNKLNDKSLPKEIKWWPLAASKLLAFFQQPLYFDNPGPLYAEDEAFIQEYLTHYKKVTLRQDYQVLMQSTSDRVWQLAQITQMGRLGLDILFQQLEEEYLSRWNNNEPAKLQEAPNLICTFDLSGNYTEGTLPYIDYLTGKIEEFAPELGQCSPLFKRISFILPHADELTPECITQIKQCINALYQRQRVHQDDEPCDILFYNLAMGTAPEKAFLTMLQEFSAQPDFYHMFRMPSWDRVTKLTDSSSKNTYRDLQNQIGNNQRLKNQHQLRQATDVLGEAVLGKLKPGLQLHQLHDENKHGVKADSVYPLPCLQTGIQQQQEQQQQMQQQMQQQHKQEQKQEQKQQEEQEEQEQQEVIQPYVGNLDKLIGRTTINNNHECKALWADIPDWIKAKSGVNQDDLSQLFSCVVGSNQSAAHIVEYMTPEAVAQIMNHANAFRLGIMNDNLPAGFYLSTLINSDKTSLVLCFDKKKEYLALNTLPRNTKTQKFKVILHRPKPAKLIHGDMMQLAHLAQSDSPLAILWRYLTPVIDDQARFTNAAEQLGRKVYETCLADAMMKERHQHFDANSMSADQSCLQGLLATWMSQFSTALPTRQTDSFPRAWASVFLNPAVNKQAFIKEFSTFLSAHSHSFGQLVNELDGDTRTNTAPYGSNTLVLMAYAVYTTFGKHYFAIWTQRLLQPLEIGLNY